MPALGAVDGLAKRDERKCRKKYGRFYDTYSEKVPYLIVPGLY